MSRYPKNISDKKIVLSIEVNAPVSEVYNAWTTEKGTQSFFAQKTKVDFRMGGVYEIYFNLDAPEGEKGSEDCHILSYLPNKMFSFEWSSPPQFKELRKLRHQVVILFDKINDNKTKVILTDHGFGTEPEWDDVIKYFEEAWEYVLSNMKKRFDEGPLF